MKKTKFFSDFSAKAVWIMQRTSEEKSVTLLNLIMVLIEMMMCDCSVCRPMPLDMENVCCKKRTCVTSYAMYQNICLDREVLTLAIRARFDILAEEPDYSTNSFRKAAYRQYCLWKYGKLGKGNRRVLFAFMRCSHNKEILPCSRWHLYGI